MKNLKMLYYVAIEAGQDWVEDQASRLGAALAYYSLFSLGPLLFVAISLTGYLLGDELVASLTFSKVEALLGPTGVKAIKEILKNIQASQQEGWAQVLGLVILVFTASGVIVQLKDAFNEIWGVAPDKGKGLVVFVRKYFVSLAGILGVGFILTVSLVVTSLASLAGNLWAEWGFLPESVILLINFVADFAVITLVFALMFKYLPDVNIYFRDVLIGAVVTSTLFILGKFLIGIYLGRIALESTYGAAGSVILVLIWIYYSSQILFFGAEFTKVYIRKQGRPVIPDDNVHIEGKALPDS